MKKYLLFFILLFSWVPVFAQTKTDTISVKPNSESVFLLNGKVLRPAQLLSLTENNPMAYNEMQAAKTNHDLAWVLSFAGGGLVGWSLADFIRGDKTNWGVFGAGAGLLVVSIPFSSAYAKRAQNGVRIYNQGISQSRPPRPIFHFGMTAGGAGINLKF